MQRPYSTYSIADLEALVHENSGVREVLIGVQYEMEHRKSRPRQVRLRAEVESLLQTLDPHSTSVQEEPSPNSPGTETLEPAPVLEIQARGGEPAEESSFDSIVWDPHQRKVIELDESQLQLVEAGPGSGKTGVACARVAWLVEECDLEPARILLISFTRAAVKEIRDRIKSAAKGSDQVDQVQIMTLDSLTWQIVRGLGQKSHDELMTSYDGNITTFTTALTEDNPEVLAYFEELEHVVLDEAQDIVGVRADLILEILKRLPSNCGVSIYSDSAQAIYGFTNDSQMLGNTASQTVVDRLSEAGNCSFDRTVLTKVHRTSDPQLQQLFSEGRRRLLAKRQGDTESWKEMKALIRNCAHGELPKVDEQRFDPGEEYLVLFRTRAEVLQASSFLWSSNVPHKLRMSGLPPRIHSWIARVFGGYTESTVNRETFQQRWNELVCDEHGQAAWELIYRFAADRKSRASMSTLREILARERPPLEFIQDEADFLGPILGTIHSSKGREADNVHLMLPQDSYCDFLVNNDRTPDAIAEEERVLYVGATRARSQLRVGETAQIYGKRANSGRVWRKTQDRNTQIEFGLAKDFVAESVADESVTDDTEGLQNWLWANRFICSAAQVRYESSIDGYLLEADDMNIGRMSEGVRRDLWQIAKKIGKDRAPSYRIKHLRLIGAASMVVQNRENLPQPWNQSGFVLVPVVTGFPKVFMNKRRGNV